MQALMVASPRNSSASFAECRIYSIGTNKDMRTATVGTLLRRAPFQRFWRATVPQSFETVLARTRRPNFASVAKGSKQTQNQTADAM
jgi:hypothetical protein